MVEFYHKYIFPGAGEKYRLKKIGNNGFMLQISTKSWNEKKFLWFIPYRKYFTMWVDHQAFNSDKEAQEYVLNVLESAKQEKETYIY